jgi:protein-tyrosine phosphatase
MSDLPPLVDIHCHLLPGFGDGAKTWEESLEMAQMAVSQGVRTAIATPHQLGMNEDNGSDKIREATRELQERLLQAGIPLTVLPGATLRVGLKLVDSVLAGAGMTMADMRRHVLVELPPDRCQGLEHVIESLRGERIVPILAQPERNQVLLAHPEKVPPLVHRGCLLQLTADSLLGTFGSAPKKMAEWLIECGLAHVVASDGHGASTRRPRMDEVYERLRKRFGQSLALLLCSRNPAAIASGRRVTTPPKGRQIGLFARLLGRVA